MNSQIFSWVSFFGHLLSTIPTLLIMVTKAGQKMGDSRPLPCKVLVTADEYLQERGYDCSIEDSISMYLPAKWIVDKLNLSWCGAEDCYFSSEGQLVAQDPSVRTEGRGALLMDKRLMSEFLECEGYRIVWTLLGREVHPRVTGKKMTTFLDGWN